MSSVGHTLDPVEAAKDDVDRSRRLIAQTLDDLSQHHSWLETYHREERQRAERLRRQEALERLELRRQRAVFQLRRFAVRSYVTARAVTISFATGTLAVLAAIRNAVRWAAPRASRLANRTVTELSTAISSSASWIWVTARLLSVRSFAALKSGFLWSVRTSEAAGVAFRRQAWRMAFVPAARLGRDAARKTAPARRRGTVFWLRARRDLRVWTHVRIANLKTWSAAIDPAIKTACKTASTAARRGGVFFARARRNAGRQFAGLTARFAGTARTIQVLSKRTKRKAARAGAGVWMRTRIVTRLLMKRLKKRSAWMTDALQAGWKKQARLASVQFARTRRRATGFEKRAVENLIRSGPRMRRFLAQHTPAQFGTKRRGRALIVRPSTALVCVSAPRSV